MENLKLVLLFTPLTGSVVSECRLTYWGPALLSGLERLFVGDCVGSGFEQGRLLLLLLLLLPLKKHKACLNPRGGCWSWTTISKGFFVLKTASHHLLPAAALYGSPLVNEQSEGFWLGGLQLLLLRQDHSVKVWQWLGLKLWSLGGSEETPVITYTTLYARGLRTHFLKAWHPLLTSSFRISSSLFSFNTRLSRSRSSKENGQTSTWWCSGRRGWKGRPKWGTGGALIGEGCFTWENKHKLKG